VKEPLKRPKHRWEDNIKIDLKEIYYEGEYKISGLAAWSENCKWYRSLPLGAVVSPFCGSV
jgi:hypothetical protein